MRPVTFLIQPNYWIDLHTCYSRFSPSLFLLGHLLAYLMMVYEGPLDARLWHKMDV